jgi:hypothetical protein
LPFKQLLACRLAQDLGQGDVFPEDTVAHFDVSSCPDGWSLHSAAQQRMLMAAPGSSGVSVGSSNVHQHTVSAQASLSTTSLAASAGGGVSCAGTTSVSLAGIAEADNTLAGLPTLELLACHKDMAPTVVATAPANTLAFQEGDSCPDGWERATTMEGRFLVGAPNGGVLGANFGGTALLSGQAAGHQHTLSGNGQVFTQAVASAGGGSTIVGASGFVSVNGVAQVVEFAPMRLELRYCRKL